LLLLLSFVTVTAWAQGAAADYKTPTFVIPYATTRPVIDGVVNDAEWQGAASEMAVQTVTHAVSPRQARFWMTWDEDNLYVAMRSPFRDGERVIQANRWTDKDINVVFDDSYEIWLDVATHSPDGQPVFFQFLSNIAAARFDCMHEPAVGNMRIGWTSGWTPKNRMTPDGKTWEMEVAIPRKSVYKNDAFADGYAFKCLIARNYKRPWEQNSVVGTGSFSVRDSYATYILSKNAPAVHLLGVTSPQDKSFGINLTASGKQDMQLKWQFASDGGVQKEGTLDVKANGLLAAIEPQLRLDTPGKGSYRITVTSADGKTTYLDWSAYRTFGDLAVLDQKMNDTGDQVSLSLSFNPVSNYVRVNGDFINYDARATIAKCQLVVTNTAGKKLAERTLKIDNLAYVSDVVKLGNLPYGEYKTTLTCYDAAGKALLTREQAFSKKDHEKEFPWWNTKIGNIDTVLSPWTPVTYKKGAFGVWGREMKVGAAGLMDQVTAQQIPLLAAPMYLVAEMADGKVVKATGNKVKVVSQANHRTVLKVTSKLGNLNITSLITVECDGMYKVDMTLDPKKATKVKSLKLVVPYANSVADYVYGKGEGIRSGMDLGFLPRDKQGQIWNCLKVDSQPMVEGSFIPYIWIGNPNGGLCWYADSDQGWVPNNNVPALEIRRDSTKSTDLIFNFISAPYSIDKARTITFAFQASPVKQMHAGWRMDTWWCGDTFRDYAGVEAKGGSLIFTSVPFTLDKEKCKQMVEAQHKGSSIMGLEKYHANAVPYFEHVNIGEGFAPEVPYFGDEWRNSARSLYYGKTFTDYMIYNLGTWAKECGIDGYYVDNVNPMSDNNIDAGRGYLLPSGKIQPTYEMFGTRKYFLRMRAAFAEQGKHNHIIFHATNNLILPWAGAADIYFDGELNVIYPEMGKDFMDFWSLERLRLNYPGQSGIAGNFLQEYQGQWDNARLVKVMRAYTGMMLLHDVLSSGNSNGLNRPVWVGRDRFGIEAADVRFIGYWQEKSGLTSGTKEVYLSGWLRPGKVLIAVVNKGEAADAEVQVDTTLLKLPTLATAKIIDAESGAEIKLNADGKLIVPVERHDYRQIIIEPKQ
jgi:hypothetical protein